MQNERDILKAIKELGRQPIPIIPGTVKSVDEDKAICVVVDADDVEKFDVRLKANIDNSDKSFLLIPKKDSSVLIARIEESNEWKIIAYSEIEKIYYKSAQAEFIIADKFTLKNNSSSLKGLLNDLITQLKTPMNITTGGGPGNFNPDTIIKFEEINTKINALFDA